MNFFTLYKPAPSPSFKSEKPSLTQQQFRDEADINNIIKRFEDPSRPISLMDISAPRVPLWGDFSAVPDVRQAHAFFQRAEASFGALPAELRARFNNNPLEMLAFVDDPANRDEVKRLFGDKAPVVKESLTPEAPSVAAVNAETVAEQKS